MSGRDNTDVGNLGRIHMEHETKPSNCDDYFAQLIFVVDENQFEVLLLTSTSASSANFL